MFNKRRYGLPKWERQNYYANNVKLSTNAEVRKAVKEYERLRKSMVRQLKKAEKKGIANEQFYQRFNRLELPVLDVRGKRVEDINKGNLKRALHELGTFHFSQFREPEEYIEERERRIEHLQDLGYDVDKSNMKQFGDYMDAMREAFGKRAVTSDTAGKLFSEFQRLDISVAEFKADILHYTDIMQRRAQNAMSRTGDYFGINELKKWNM